MLKKREIEDLERDIDICTQDQSMKKLKLDLALSGLNELLEDM